MTQRVCYPHPLDVNESLLRWALERSKKSVDALSKKQDLKNLDKWLDGTKKPTRNQLEMFARATYTPFGYLLLSEPPHDQPSPIPHFRTMKNNKPPKRSLDLEDTIKIIKRRQDWVRDYFKEVGAEPLEFVGSSKMDDNPVEVANTIRTKLGLKQNWAAKYTKWERAQIHLREKIEDARIFLSMDSMVKNNYYRRLDPKEFRGFVLVDDYAPFVFVNSADVVGAQMFTLAHELAHVWVGKSASFDLHHLASAPDNNLELTCNRIAAEFLVPTEEMIRYWDQFTESPDDTYRSVSRHFKVSRIVAARRALDTELITGKEFKEFYDRYMAEAHKRQEQLKEERKDKQGPLFYNFAPLHISKRFIRTVITAIGERRILYREAYSLTGLKSESFDAIKKIMEGSKK